MSKKVDTFAFQSPYAKYKCVLEYYPEKHLIQMYSLDDEYGYMEPYATVTATPSNRKVPEGYVAVKNYSENSGIMERLIELGILAEPEDMIPAGFTCLYLCKVLPEIGKYNINQEG